jgi:hypothetical protein
MGRESVVPLFGNHPRRQAKPQVRPKHLRQVHVDLPQIGQMFLITHSHGNLTKGETLVLLDKTLVGDWVVVTGNGICTVPLGQLLLRKWLVRARV